jgi:hypothetical protein
MLHANIVFLPFFWMANPERPLPLSTVIWFGSLEFMSLGHGYDMVLSRAGTRPTWTTSSPSLGEPCTGIVALVRHAPLGDGEPSATTVIALRRVMVFPDPAPLIQTPTWISSLRIYVG